MAHAADQWLCREASSNRSGQTITACGVGRSQTLEEARVKSRESAIEEFKRVCQLSADCSEYDYSVVPKRTDCEFQAGVHICYRALDFEISDRKKKSVELDLADLQSQLNQRNQEIQHIQDSIDKINQLKQSEEEATQKKRELADLQTNLNQKEADAVKLEDLNSKDTIESSGYQYLHKIFENSVKLSLSIWDSRLTSSSTADFLFLLAYERRPLSWLGLQVYGGAGAGQRGDTSSENDPPSQGAPNSTQNLTVTSSYSDLGLGVLIYPGWRGVYLKGEVGNISGHRTSEDVVFNSSGFGTPVKSTTNLSDSYNGLHFGYNTKGDKKRWGGYFEIGARKLKTQTSPGIMGSAGLNYSF